MSRRRRFLVVGPLCALLGILGLPALTVSAEAADTVRYTVSPDAIAFGTVNVGSTKLMTATVTNNSTIPVAFDSTITTPTTGVFAFIRPGAGPSGNCSYRTFEEQSRLVSVVMAPGQSCTLQYVFAPQTAGAQTGQARVNAWAAPGAAPGSLRTIDETPTTSSPLNLSGNGNVQAGTPTVSIESYDLAWSATTVGTTQQHAVTVRNRSSSSITVMPYTNGAFSIVLGEQGYTECDLGQGTAARFLILPANATCVILVDYTPISAGLDTENLVLDLRNRTGTDYAYVPTNGSPIDNTMSFAMTGTGVRPSVDVRQEDLSWTPTTVGDTQSHLVTVINRSAVPITIAPSVSGPFSIGTVSGYTDCARGTGANARYAIIPKDNNCVVQVDYTATTAGSEPGSLVLELRARKGAAYAYVADDETRAGAVVTSALTGRGIAPTVDVRQADLTWTPTRLGTKQSHLVTVINRSDAPITIAPTVSGPFSIGTVPGYTDCARGTGSDARYAIIPKDNNCLVQVDYTPTRLGVETGELKLDLRVRKGAAYAYVAADSKPVGGTVRSPLTGSGSDATTPVVSVTSDASTYQWPSTTIGTTSERVINVVNRSDTPITIKPSVSGPYSVAVGQQGYTECDLGEGTNARYLVIPQDNNCQIIVRFSPLAAGNQQGSLALELRSRDAANYSYVADDGTPAAKVMGFALTGPGVAPTVDVRQEDLTWTTTTIGNTQSHLVTVINRSDAPITIAPTVSGPFSIGTVPGYTDCARGTGSDARYAIIPKDNNCLIQVDYTPTVGAQQTGQLRLDLRARSGAAYAYVPSNNSPIGNTQTFTLTGTGVQPTVTVVPGTLVVPPTTVGGSRMAFVSLRNISDTAVTIKPSTSGPFSILTGHPAGGNECDLGGGTTDRYLIVPKGGNNCTVAVLYSPVAIGNVSQALVLEVRPRAGAGYSYVAADGTPPANTLRFTLSGTGVAPTVAVGDRDREFPTTTRGTTNTRVIKVRNTSDVSITVKPSTTGPYAVRLGTFGSEDCDRGPSVTNRYVVIPPGANGCSVVVDFTPTATGQQDGTLVLEVRARTGAAYSFVAADGKPAGNTMSFPLTGTGKAPLVALDLGLIRLILGVS